jgi:flagellar hook-associated protein 3 FlgL
MRITDTYLQNTFLNSLSRARKTETDLQTQVSTQTKIQKTSDNPLSAARINRLQEQLQNIDTYSSNISEGQSYLTSASSAMEGMQTETQNIITDLTTASNATNTSTITSFGDKVKQALQAIVQYANTEVNGKYVFSGTNTQSPAYDKDATWYGGTIDTSGSQSIRISSSSDQKINVTADDIFQSTLSQSGTLDKTAAVGATAQTTSQVQNADGANYSVAVTYTKTGTGAYTMQYDVKDTSGSVVSTGQQQLQFDATTGKLSTINGAAPQKITINDKTDKINFSIDASNLTEGTSGNVSSSLSQPTNILNAIQSIADTLSAGKLPTDAQENLLNDFNNRLLQKITQVGGVQNRLTDTSDMLTSQQTQLQDLLSKERDTDVAKASIDLQSAQYTTEMLYKTSAMILPKSLLDYMA